MTFQYYYPLVGNGDVFGQRFSKEGNDSAYTSPSFSFAGLNTHNFAIFTFLF